MSGDIQDALYNIFVQCKGNDLLKVLGTMNAKQMNHIEKLAEVVSDVEIY